MPRETRTPPPRAVSSALGATGSRPSESGILRKEGEYWTVGYRNSAFRLRDTKGLAYLAHLLRHPGTEFHVLDLVGGIASQREDEANDSARGLARGKEGFAEGVGH